MRLAVEITTCTALRTGVGYYTQHLVDALLETRGAGDDVVLLSNRPPAPELADRWAQHVHIVGPGVRAVWMQVSVPRMLSDTGADLGVFPNYAAPVASPCPVMVVVHDLAVLRVPHFFTARKRFLSRPMLNFVVATAPVIGTVSEASRRDIVALLGVSPERVALLPGAAHPSCRPATPEQVTAVRARHGLRRPYVLTVGTLEPRKDLPTLLRAFDRLGVETSHELVVVGGRGWKDRRLVEALETREANRHVRWLGYVPESDLTALYTGADLFVFAPTLEGFGLPLLEAMACGTPVIAADIDALREVAGDAAQFVAPSDDAAFARAIAQQLKDPARSERWRAAGQKRAEQFSWTATAEALWARARATAPTRFRPVAGRLAPDRATPSLPLPPPPALLGAREWALLATVVYADLFESPLPLRRALTASIGAVFDEPEVHRLVTGPALARLVTLHPAGFLVLAGREHLVDAMPEREALTRALLDRNRATLSILAALPFVRALVISGGVAHKNAGARPDVDLFVVAAAGRAYTTYSLIVLVTKLTGTRHAICPNYLVDERELPIAYHRDLFTAHQLATALPFSGRPTYEALCSANAWVRAFFPGFAARTAAESREPGPLQAATERALGPVAPALESVLRSFWRFRLRRRAAAARHADVVVADGILKMHLSDYRRVVLDRFATRLESLRVALGSDAEARSSDLEPVGT